MRRHNDIWLNTWRSNNHNSRTVYSRSYSARLGYRIFLSLVTIIIVCLLIIVGLYRNKIKNSPQNQLPNQPRSGISYLTASAADSVNGIGVAGSQPLGTFNRNKLFETDPKTNKPLAGVKAKSYYIAKGDTPAFEYNPTKILPIASITKLITATVASELMDKDAVITIDKSILSTEGNQGGFKVGDKITVSEILHPLLMVSSNDAAEAIAQKYGRSDFIVAMNAWAWKIGAYSTNFEDPSGLTPHNVSTARDLAIIVRYIQTNHPELIDITATKNYRLRKYSWTNPTNFLNMSSYLGGKNGFTDEAEQTAVAIFANPTGGIGGTSVTGGASGSSKTLAIVLDSPTRDMDVLALLRYIE